MNRMSFWIMTAAMLAAAPIIGAVAAAPAGDASVVAVSPAPLRVADGSSTTTTPSTDQTDQDGGGSDDGGGTDDGNGAPHQ